MRQGTWLVAALVLSVLFAAVETTAQPIINPNRPEPPQQRYVPGRVIVTLVDGADVEDVIRTHGFKADKKFKRVIRGFAGELPPGQAKKLLEDPRVKKVEDDAIVTITQTIGWGQDRIDQRSLPLDGSYTPGQSGQDVTAYIVDSGIRYDHIEFNSRASFGYDAFGGNGSDCNGHGTHVAGTVGGQRYGVAPGVSLVSVKVLDCNGSGYTSGVIAGLDWILENAQTPAVVNMSLGGPVVSALDAAVLRLINAGIPVVVAAGNSNVDACGGSPARVGQAITVGASDRYDRRASFSNYGTCLDLFAPGVSIPAAYHSASNTLAYMSGTSMASPAVAGAVALLLDQYPSLSAVAVNDSIRARTTRSVITSSLSTNNHVLYVRGSSGSGTTPPNAAPTANFTQNCSYLACTFSDGSADSDGSIVAWQWDFGNGATSSLRNPSYTYSAAGTYTVRLTVTDDDGATATASKSVTVAAQAPVNNPPVADFTSQCTGLVCTFVDQSSDSDGNIASWLWNFGNGAASTQRNPSYTYPQAGTYNVTLTVTDNDGASSARTRSVTVNAPAPTNQLPTAAFTVNCGDLACSFTDGSSDADGSIAAWQWSFGDGATSSQRNPSYTYSQSGTYNVTLTVTDNSGATASASRSVSVVAPTQPPPPTGSITLTATVSTSRNGNKKVVLEWTGISAGEVDVYKNGALIFTYPNSGSLSDNVGRVSNVTYTYKVCVPGTSTCSNEVQVQIQ